MNVLEEVAAVADAVLFEGYLLYPYRASAQKNRVRWQFGVLTPAADAGEPSASRTECLLEPGAATHVHVRLRFLQLEARSPRTRDGRPVGELVVDGRRHLRFEEGTPRQVDATREVADLGAGSVVRETWPLRGRIVVSLTDLPGPYLVHRLRVDVVNDGDADPGAPRAEILRTSLIAAHTVISAPGATFLSLTDPPRWAAPAVAGCVNTHTWPVLAGPPGCTDVVLSSPIILADHPQLAPESTIDLFDGCENDEILTLRTLVLTDEEKAEARATDPRAAGIIDAVEHLPPELWERLHGAVRSLRSVGADSPAERPPERLPWWDPGVDASVDPDIDSVPVGGVPVSRGSAVVLRPGPHGDIQDRFLDGLRATVAAVVHDVDGGVHVAVTVDGDPAAEPQLAHGRFRYFRPDELEAVR